MSTKRLSLIFALGVLALAVALPLAAAGTAPNELALQLQYQEISPSVWQRADASGAVEHVAIGPEGLAWALTQLHEQSNRELELYLKEPTAKRWARVEEVATTMEQMRADITHARSMGLGDALQALQQAAQACDYNYSAQASAGPLNVGATASSSASWWNNCGDVGSIYCYAYARVNSTSNYESHGGSNATSISNSCSASVSGSGDCYSYAHAYVYVSALSIYFDRSATNTDCGSAPLSASLSCSQPGPGQGYPQVGCTGSASGGAPPYHAYWKEGSYSEYEAYGSPGSGPWSYTTICKYLSTPFTPFQVRLRVVDSHGAQQSRYWYCGLAP
jgi:hypothetical protein